MSRFTRFSRISPLELCREQERLAWRSAAGLFALFLALAAGGLYLHAPAGYVPGRARADFEAVSLTEPELQAAPVTVLPPLALPAVEAEVLPELACTFSPPAPQATPSLEWEAVEPLTDDEPLLVLELPEQLAASRRRPVAPVSPGSHVAEAASARGAAAALGELVAASYRSTPRPPYPPGMLSRRAQGRVGLRIEVNAEGVPLRVEVASSSGHAAFDRLAREWVLAHWRFYPARQGGVAVASIVHTQVEFVLR